MSKPKKPAESYQIISSTDRQFIGREIDTGGNIRGLDDQFFTPTQVQQIGEGYIRLSNSNYSIEARKL